MRATSALVLLLLAAVSCQKNLFSGTPRWMRMQDRYKYMSASHPDNPDPPDDDPKGGPSVYVSALRFPEGTPWRSGDLSGAHLVLWKNGKEILDVPAGHYPEPDRHRIRDGHLWWDDSDGGSTRLYQDQDVMLSYEGDEILRGLLDVDGDLHTLGQRAGGGGISYRINGSLVFSHPSAQLPGSFDDQEWEGGALMRDGEDVYYYYALPVKNQGETLWEYHVMQGDQEIRKILAGEARTVFDIRVWGGNVYRSELRGSGGTSLAMVRGEKIILLGLGEEEKAHLCRLVPSGGEMLVKGYSTRSGSNGYSYWLRGKDGPVQQLESLLPLAAQYPDNPENAAIYLEGNRVKDIWNGKRHLNIIQGRYVLYTPACSALYEGTLYAALSDNYGSSHLLVQGDQVTTYTFNGCFTGIRIE